MVNRLESYLQCFVMEKPKLWRHFLPWAEYSFNTGFHSTAGMTPFNVVHSIVVARHAYLILKLSCWPEMKYCISLSSICKKAQNQMAQLANAHRREAQYNVGYLVFLRVQPYRQKTLAGHSNQKLSPRCFGP
ncbi:hypothetical protein V2J09_004436 [Rumex salicifolius]